MNMAFKQFERTSLQLSMGIVLSCLCASVTYADTLAPANPATVDACVALASNADRLACYDSVFKPAALPVVQAAVVPEPVKKLISLLFNQKHLKRRL
jgi:phospholipase A1